MLLAPIALFAERGLGGAVFLAAPVTTGQANPAPEGIDSLALGVDLRLSSGFFQLEALATGSVGAPGLLDLYLDAGLVFDEDGLGISLVAGPAFRLDAAEGTGLGTGLQAKLSLDLFLGPFSLGLSYLMAMSLEDGFDLTTRSGLLGAQLLFWF